MKSYIAALIATAMIWSCGSNHTPQTKTPRQSDTPKPIVESEIKSESGADETEEVKTQAESASEMLNLLEGSEGFKDAMIGNEGQDKSATEVFTGGGRGAGTAGVRTRSLGLAGGAAAGGGGSQSIGGGILPSPSPAPVIGPSDPMPVKHDREGYNPIYENPFLDARGNPLSTFSIDVDAASYSNMRRYIMDSTMPPRDAVRIEEMVNYFTYDYPEPNSEHPFSVVTEASVAPWNPQHRLVHIGIQGRHIETENLPPSNLVFLLDVSGSMNYHDKLPLLKSAFRLLVGELRPQDRVAIVVYAGAAGMVLPSTPGSDKGTIMSVLNRLNAGGSTAGGAGINLAYQIAQEHFIEEGNNRVILATDGDFNVGVSSESGLVQLIEEKRKNGVFLTVLGFGTGNLQDAKMEQLADKGNGNYAYIDNIMEARKVLVKEMGGTLATIAKDVKIQVEFNPAHVQAYRLIGYENRMLRKEDFNDDKKDAGELGAGHTVTALYEIVPPGVDINLPKVDDLKYQNQLRSDGDPENPEIMLVKLRYKQPTGQKSSLIEQPVLHTATRLENTSDNFRFSAAVAEFGMLLRQSKHMGEASYHQASGLARGAKGDDAEGYRAEFIRLIDTAALIAPHLSER